MASSQKFYVAPASQQCLRHLLFVQKSLICILVGYELPEPHQNVCTEPKSKPLINDGALQHWQKDNGKILLKEGTTIQFYCDVVMFAALGEFFLH
jgi:hypothetical protein